MTKEQTEQLKLDNQLCFRLYTASRLIVQSYQPYLSELGITYTQYLALMVLWEKSPVKVSEISSRLKLESNTVTPLVKRMEAQGLVKREKGKQDGRETIVSLTQKGKSLEKEAARIPSCLSGKLHSCGIQDETMLAMVPCLDDLIAKLSSAEGVSTF